MKCAPRWFLLGVLVYAAVPAGSFAFPSELTAVETPPERQLRQVREMERVELEKTLTAPRKSSQALWRKAELLFRRAELELDAYRSVLILEGRAGTRLRRYSGDHLHAAIAAAQEIIKLGVRYERLDQVYFFLGYAHEEMGHEKTALLFYKNLAAFYPKSRLVSEAWIRVGDDLFNRKSYGESLRAYQKALKSQPGENTPRILHKLAWCLFRTRKLDEAIRTLKRAVDLAYKTDEKLLGVKEEALRDLAFFYAEKGTFSEAVAYFKSRADLDGVLKLGEELERRGDRETLSHLYYLALNLDPNADQRVKILSHLVELEGEQENGPARVNTILARLQKELGSGKVLEGVSDTAATKQFRDRLWTVAVKAHSALRASKEALNRRKTDLQATERLYAWTHSEFGREQPEALVGNWCDILTQLDRSPEALIIALEALKAHPDIAHVKLFFGLAATEAGILSKTKNSSRESALTAHVREGIQLVWESGLDGEPVREAALRWIQLRADENVPEMELWSRRFLEKWPSSAETIPVARIWLQRSRDEALAFLDRHAEILEWDRTQGSKLAQDLAQSRRFEQLQAVKTLKGEGKLTYALDRLEIWYMEELQRDVKIKILSQACSLLRGPDIALEMRQQGVTKAARLFLRADRSHVLDAKACGMNLVNWSLIFTQWANAVELLEFLSPSPDKSSEDRARLATAARVASGLHAEVIDSDLRLMDRLMDRATHQERQSAVQAERIRWIASVYERLAMPTRALSWLARCPEESASCLADRLRLMKDSKERERRLQDLVRMKAGIYSAYAAFELARLEESRLGSGPKRKLASTQKTQAWITKRLKEFERLNALYRKSVEFGGPYGLAALGRLGGWVLDFSAQVRRQEGVASSRTAQTLEDRAVQILQEARSEATRTEALSPELAVWVDRLAERRPELAHPSQSSLARLRIVGLSPRSQDRLSEVQGRFFADGTDRSAWIDFGNLLWGQGRFELARLAYRRVLELDPRDPNGLQNDAVVTLSSDRNPSVWAFSSAQDQLRQALKKDPKFLSPKHNLAVLLNYFRVHDRALPLWKEVQAEATTAESLEGMTFAALGMRNQKLAQENLNRWRGQVTEAQRLSFQYADAAYSLLDPKAGVCRDILKSEKRGDSLSALEQAAWTRLWERCGRKSG